MSQINETRGNLLMSNFETHPESVGVKTSNTWQIPSKPNMAQVFGLTMLTRHMYQDIG